MKIITPYYYKNFKCIAGACTDTCCAGWDVDVDDDSYRFYKSVRGDFGKRLKSVMVPEKDGGCTFTLTPDKRCPFLNDKNLCDLYVALGEEHLCETCDEFPRFINEYGSVKEIGIAPSCITAGQLMFSGREKMHFEEHEDGKPVDGYNDIDAFLYLQLKNARHLAFDIIDLDDFDTDEVCVLLLKFAKQIQKHMDAERDDLIGNVVRKFKSRDYCKDLVAACRKRLELKKSEARASGKLKKSDITAISHFFDSFDGMEVINNDWMKYVEMEREFENTIKNCAQSDLQTQKKSNYKIEKIGHSDADTLYSKKLADFRNHYADREYQYRQLLDYYVFRYFLDSVYDIDLVLKIKNAVVGYLIVRQLDMVCWHKNKKVSFDDHVDIAHLYSRQFEHSYTNFEVYSEYFKTKRCYSINTLEGLLLL